MAALLSLLAFGLGQLYTGRLWWVLGLVGTWLVLLAMFQTDIPSTLAGFVLVVVGLAATGLVAVVHATVTAWQNPIIARQPFHRWYVYVAYIVVLGLAMPADQQEFRSLFGAYHPYRVTSFSMEPTLQPGDFFLVKEVEGDERAALAQKVGAVVTHSWDGVEGTYIHRLVATAAQSVAVRGMDVLIDGKALSRKALCSAAPKSGSRYNTLLSAEANGGRVYAVQHFDDEWERDREDAIVPEESFFVLGDSRDLSNDSRYHGPIHNDRLRGVALFIFWSNNWRRIGKSLTVEAPSPTREDVCDVETTP